MIPDLERNELPVLRRIRNGLFVACGRQLPEAQTVFWRSASPGGIVRMSGSPCHCLSTGGAARPGGGSDSAAKGAGMLPPRCPGAVQQRRCLRKRSGSAIPCRGLAGCRGILNWRSVLRAQQSTAPSVRWLSGSGRMRLLCRCSCFQDCAAHDNRRRYSEGWFEKFNHPA